MRFIRILILSLLVIGTVYLSLFFYFQRTQLNTYNNLLTDLNQLYDLSIKGQKPLNSNCNKVMGYMFESKQNDNYKLVEWCNNGYYVFKNIDLNKNIVSIDPLFPTTTFKINGSFTNLSNNNQITLKRRYLGKNYEIVITVDGEVLGD